MTSPESGSREPVCECGCSGAALALCVCHDPPFDGRDEYAEATDAAMNYGHGVADERERFAEALVRAVEELGSMGGFMDWPKGRPNGAFQTELVRRAAVLRAISALRSPADTGEHQEGDVGS